MVNYVDMSEQERVNQPRETEVRRKRLIPYIGVSKKEIR